MFFTVRPAFESAVGVFRSVHYVQRKTFENRFDDGVSFFVVIDEFARIWRTNVQLSVVSDNAIFDFFKILFIVG